MLIFMGTIEAYFFTVELVASKGRNILYVLLNFFRGWGMLVLDYIRWSLLLTVLQLVRSPPPPSRRALGELVACFRWGTFDVSKLFNSML